jgi:hypothetical protein
VCLSIYCWRNSSNRNSQKLYNTELRHFLSHHEPGCWYVDHQIYHDLLNFLLKSFLNSYYIYIHVGFDIWTRFNIVNRAVLIPMLMMLILKFVAVLGSTFWTVPGKCSALISGWNPLRILHFHLYCRVFARKRDKKLYGFSDLNEYLYWTVTFTLTLTVILHLYRPLDVSSPVLQYFCSAILVKCLLFGAQLSLVPSRIRNLLF